MGGREEHGRWALVAGASEGIGAAFAHGLAARGHDLLLVARRKEPLEALAVLLRQAHKIEVVTAAIDLGAPSVETEVAALIDGREIGVLICNAALAPQGAFVDQPLPDKLKAIEVNCRSPVVLAHLVLPTMIARRRGAIVLMSSLTAFQGSPYVSVYGATKGFNLCLAEALWSEAAPHGVKVIATCAGATRTPAYLKSMAKSAPGELDPEQVAEETLAALASGPMIIPGAFNRFASFMMRRLMPRRSAIKLIGAETHKRLR